MKLPGWIVTHNPKGRLSADGRSVEFDVSLRRWHPGLWLVVLRLVLRRLR